MAALPAGDAEEAEEGGARGGVHGCSVGESGQFGLRASGVCRLSSDLRLGRGRLAGWRLCSMLQLPIGALPGLGTTQVLECRYGILRELSA